VPSIGGKELDLFKLYKAVIARGGSQRVSNNKMWKEIVNEFEIPPSCTSASFTLRNHYNRCLLQYENKYFHGNTDDGFDNLTESKYNKGMGLASSYTGVGYSGDGIPRRQDGGAFPSYMQPVGPHVVSNIATQAASVNLASKYSTAKKVQLSQVEAENKRLVLAFESHIITEVQWALNTLAIFSCNVEAPFTLEN